MKYRFAEMTMHEIKDAVQQQRVAVLPVATFEDHGPHLPVDTDVVLATEICERAVARCASNAILIPAVPHGYSPHHMDYHGTLTVGWDTFIRYVKDVCCSLAHHGFTRILLVNGHGSNASPLDLAARLTNVEYEGKVLCAFVSHWDLRRVKQVAETLRDSDFNGAAHAGEYETSLYLALKPGLVDMSKAVDEHTPLPPSFSIDLLSGVHPEGSAARLMPYWSSLTASGVMGDATKATKEKGEKFLAAAVEGLGDLIGELKQTPLPERRDQHETPPMIRNRAWT